MKQYRITDIPGYNENALNVAQHNIEE